MGEYLRALPCIPLRWAMGVGTSGVSYGGTPGRMVMVFGNSSDDCKASEPVGSATPKL